MLNTCVEDMRVDKWSVLSGGPTTVFNGKTKYIKSHRLEEENILRDMIKSSQTAMELILIIFRLS